MSIIFPGYDTKHLIKSAINSKTLGELGRIEDSAHPKQIPPLSIYSNKFPYDFNKKAIQQKIEGKTPEEILQYAGISTKTLKDGSKAISEYSQPSLLYSYSDIDVDESKLIEDVTTVLSDFNLRRSSLKNTGNIHTINGDLVLGDNSETKDLSSIKEVYGSVLICAQSKEEAFKKLRGLHFSPEKFSGKVIILNNDF